MNTKQQETFKRGDTLAISEHKQPKGKGLSYTDMIAVALENGAIGGWDVYDGQLDDGSQVSFYGFSVAGVVWTPTDTDKTLIPEITNFVSYDKKS